MAKKVKISKEEVATLQAEFKDADIEKLYGNVLFSGDKVFATRNKVIIPVSPAANPHIGGGIPHGCAITLAGQPKSGKTSLALKIAYNAHKPEYTIPECPDGRKVFILSVEARLADRDIEVYDWDYSRLSVIRSTKEKILNAQEWLTIAELLLRKYPGCVVLVDSYSALCTEEEATSEMDKLQRADGAKLLYKFFRKVRDVITVNDSILIGVNHMMANPSGKGKEFKEKGGQAVIYYADVRLLAKYHQYVNIGANEDSEVIGQTINWQVLASPICKPGGKFTSFLRYYEGIDDAMEICQMAIDLNLIKKSGAWYSLSMIENEPKFQGIEKLRLAVKEHPDWMKQIQSDINEMLGIKQEEILND